jgi:RHS repeat-associated protein
MGTTTFVWDLVFDCVSHELDENSDVKAVYHIEPQQYGGVISQRRGTTTSTHHHDALCSTRILTDSTGNVTDTYLNDAWGNNVASTGTTVNPFKWVGKYGYYADDSTAQVYVRSRMYQPAVARWVSIDQMLFELSRHAKYAKLLGGTWREILQKAFRSLLTTRLGAFEGKESSCAPCDRIWNPNSTFSIDPNGTVVW